MKALENLDRTYKLPDAPKDVIKAVQHQLISVGLLDSVSDGICGKLTLAAFAKFKQLEFLQYPELLGQSTAIALLEATYNHKLPQDTFTPLPNSRRVLFPKVGFVKDTDFVHLGGHFTWGEFTKNLSRVPRDEQVVDGIERLAYYLEGVRSQFGNPAITINSAYRPTEINRAIGGASNSQHLYGAAADIVVGGIRPHEVYGRLEKCHGSKGGLGNSANFTHIDLRGYKARWAYGNA